MILWFTSGGGWLRESGVLGTLLGSTVVVVLTTFFFFVLDYCLRRRSLYEALRFPRKHR